MSLVRSFWLAAERAALLPTNRAASHDEFLQREHHTHTRIQSITQALCTAGASQLDFPASGHTVFSGRKAKRSSRWKQHQGGRAGSFIIMRIQEYSGTLRAHPVKEIEKGKERGSIASLIHLSTPHGIRVRAQ